MHIHPFRPLLGSSCSINTGRNSAGCHIAGILLDTIYSDLLKPVTVVMSVTVLSRVVTGFVDTVTGCHGLLTWLSRGITGFV